MELDYLRPLSTSIELFGLEVNEPVTTLTDFIVSIVCLFAYLGLRRHKGDKRVMFYYRFFFLSLALATFIGGLVGHAFYNYFGFYWKLPGWIISMVSVAFLERIAIERSRALIKPKICYLFMRLNFIELATFIVITVYTMNFYFVEIHAAYGMLVVVSGFEVYNYLKTKNPSSKNLLFAVSLLVVAAFAHILKLSFGKWFNFFDVGHILMAISAWFIYKAAKQQPIVSH